MAQDTCSSTQVLVASPGQCEGTLNNTATVLYMLMLNFG